MKTKEAIEMNEIVGGILVLIFLLVYFLPSMIGAKKKNASAIFVLNLFLGWSIIGWVVALIWATTKEDINLKKCPKCAEEIKSEALVCRFCGFEFPLKPELIDDSNSSPIKAEDIDALWKRRQKVKEKMGRL